MKRLCLTLATATLLLTAGPGWARAASEADAAAGRALVKRYADAVVSVELVVTLKVKMGDREAPPREQRIEVNGTRGRVLIRDTVRHFEFQRAGDEVAQSWEAGYFNDRDREFHRTFDRHMDEVLAAFRAGEAPPIHASWGRRALQLALAAISSYESGRRVLTP